MDATTAPARRWLFPALESPAMAPVVPDPAAWLRALGTALAAVAGDPVVVDAAPAPPEAPTVAFVRDDGVRLALDLPRELAAAIVGRRCGGAFDPAGTDLAAPSVARVHRDLATAACRAADVAWPGTGEWTRAAPDPAIPARGATLAVGGHVFAIGFAVALPPPPVAVVTPETGARWSRAVRRAVAAMPYDLRVVLHEAPMTLAAASRLRPGDVIPIDTASAVLLRVGAHPLARGTVAPDGRGGHVITIVGGPSRGLTRPQPEDDR